ncbi:PAS domain-containing protein [Aspergillus avenaceus]|uniref:PAS domain-containing protein n=1 Tax=Aspergillus avenaceus TaxID=36643 RepID=A0A5N6TDH8_ASPAV|nr:PAS domain-containing protein [Aspergillus avenaceus]
MEGFNDGFYDAHYSVPATDQQPDYPQSSNNHHAPMMGSFSAPDQMLAGGFAYQSHSPDLVANSASFIFPSHLSTPGVDLNLEDQIPNSMFSYGQPASVNDSSSALGTGSDFYNTFVPPFSTMPPENYQDQQPASHHTIPIQSQSSNLNNAAAFSAMQQPHESITDDYWVPPNHPDHLATLPSSVVHNPLPSTSSQPADAAPQHRRARRVQSPTQQPLSSASAHRFIQPKRPSPVKAPLPPHPKLAASEDSQYASIYSSSGFDIMGVLAEVVSRPNPKINIGAVDLSCAFVLCDITQHDHPIIYVSEAFERLTGYTEQEIVGQNCRFLQGPDGLVQQGTKRTFVDSQTALRLRTTIEERTEIQASIINYRKGGQPFMNLITMIPIRWNSNDYRFYVGFQVDLVETPEAVTRRNPNGTYTINYQRNQLPGYVVPSHDIYRSRPDLATWFTHDQVSNILENLDKLGSEHRRYLDRVLVENTADVIHVLSFDGEFLYVSPSCRKVLEYDPAELVGKTLSTVCHPSDIGPVIRDLRACTTTDPVSVVFRMRKKHSGYNWFESHGSWHLGDRGRQFMILVGRTRLVYCLDQIRNVEGLAETDIWIKLSKSGIILFITSKVRPVLSRVPDDLVGKSLQDLSDARTEVQRALGAARYGQRATFSHRIRHKKGHMLPAQTTLYPGDTKEGVKPSFLVAQVRFPKPPQANLDEPNLTESMNVGVPCQSDPETSNIAGRGPPSTDSNQTDSPIQEPTLFTELVPTRGSSWQVELRELEKQNRMLSDELQRLLTRRKKRKRKQSTASVEKSCAMCRTKKTPEWRRGPSGERDLCNSCGLRWAKQVRNAAQPAGRPIA